MTSAYFQRKIARLYGKTDQNGKTCNFVNFYPGNVVKCLNESLNLILSKFIYINNEILILMKIFLKMTGGIPKKQEVTSFDVTTSDFFQNFRKRFFY